MSRLVSLTAENIKRLELAEIAFPPGEHLVTIAGRNAQGKTSALDALAMALGGAALCPERPLRDGEETGYVRALLDDGLVVTRRLTQKNQSKGGTLEVTTADGASYKSPQAILDKLVGKLGLDPLEFVRQDRKKQLETLKRLVGLDFALVDEKRRALYDQRTQVNREAASIEARLRSMPRHDDAPAAVISVSALVEELNEAQAINRDNAETRAAAERAKVEPVAVEAEIAKARAKVEELKKLLAQWEAHLAKKEEALVACLARIDDLDAEANAVVDVDTSAITQRMVQAEELNRKLADNAARAQVEADLCGASARSDDLTAQIERIDAQKATDLAAANFPIPGLSFDSDGVLYQGVPFSQASGAEQIRAATAIALALNPKLSLAIVRDGSLLDDDSMRLMAEVAEEKDGLIVMERVGSQGSVVIEAGRVVGGEPAPKAKRVRKGAALPPAPVVETPALAEAEEPSDDASLFDAPEEA